LRDTKSWNLNLKVKKLLSQKR